MFHIEDVLRVLADERDNCQRKVNQGVLRSDLNQSLAALGSMEVIDRLKQTFQIEDGRQLQAELRVFPKRKAVRA